MKEVYDAGCLAYCYSFIALNGMKWKDKDELYAEMTRLVTLGRLKKLLSYNCYVGKPEQFLKLCNGKDYKVSYKTINDLSEIIEPTPVEYSYYNSKTDKTYSHFVVVANGKIVFDSLVASNCIKYGKPISARIIQTI